MKFSEIQKGVLVKPYFTIIILFLLSVRYVHFVSFI